jgi:glutamate formiminotransferase/formiminotetrahydrofolate cyclodeaminase
MVANLSAHKPGWEERWEEFSRWAERGKQCWSELVVLVDRDTDAFRALMSAFSLPQASDADKSARKAAIQAATRVAIEVPLRTMEVALEAMTVVAAMAQDGLPASISDAAVGALCARAAVRGAAFNVRINAKSLQDAALREELLSRATRLESEAEERERAILAVVATRM